MSNNDDEQSDVLYERALRVAIGSAEGPIKIFTSDELLALEVVNKVEELMLLMQTLIDQQLVRLFQLEQRMLFSFRPRDIADKLTRLKPEDVMVYTHIESSGTGASWIKELKNKTGLNQGAVTKCLKILEGKGLIKPVKNIKNPNQKQYTLSHLDPGEELVGGAWHTDGVLDMEMIGVTADLVVRFIEGRSWKKGHIRMERPRSISPIASLSAPQDTAATGVKRKRVIANTEDIEDMPSKPGHRRRSATSYVNIDTQVPHPPGYDGYPTAEQLLTFIQTAGFLKDAAKFKQEDVQLLLDVLILDRRIEKVGISGYRTVKGVKGASDAMKNAYAGKPLDETGDDVEGTGLTQTPCGRCPVYNLCQQGGPVSAENCEYFEVWLKA